MIDAAWLPFILLLMSDTFTWRFVFGLWLLATLSGGGSHAAAPVSI